MISNINYEAMNHIYNGMIIEDITDYTVLFINKKAKKLLQITDEHEITSLMQLVSNESAYEEFKNRITSDLKSQQKSDGVIFFKRLDDSFLKVDFTCHWLFEEKNILCYTFKKAADVMTERNLSFKEVTEHLPNNILVINIDDDFSITYANTSQYRMLGIDDQLLDPDTNYFLEDFIYQEDISWVTAEIRSHFSKDEGVDIEFRMKTDDDNIKWVRLYGRSGVSDTGEHLFYSSIEDLTDTKHVADKLHLERVLIYKISELTEEILFRLDLQTNTMNFLGKTAQVFGNKTIFENYPDSLTELKKIHPDDAFLHNDLVHCFHNGIEKPIDIRYNVGEGLYEWYRVTYNFFNDKNGKPISVVGKMSNIHIQKSLEKRAKTDLLTDFYNKVTTKQEVDKLMTYKNEKSFAFFIVDIDNFKAIADNFEAKFVDSVLYEIANDIRVCFRQDDILGRIGGDVFVIAMRNTGNTSAIVEKAENLCELLNKSYEDDNDKKHNISASIGISMYPSDGLTFEELYEKADKALYEIKNTTKNSYKQYVNNVNLKNISHNHKNYQDKRRNTVLLNNAIINTVLNLLYETTEFENKMTLVLEYVIKIFRLDSCYIFEAVDSEDVFTCNYNSFSERHNNCNILKEIKKSEKNKILDLVDKDGVFYTADIDNITDPDSMESLKKADVKSMFLVDSLDKYSERSVFFAEDCKSKRLWSEEEIITLLQISRLLFTAIHNQNLILKLESNK